MEAIIAVGRVSEGSTSTSTTTNDIWDIVSSYVEGTSSSENDKEFESNNGKDLKVWFLENEQGPMSRAFSDLGLPRAFLSSETVSGSVRLRKE